MVDHSSLESGTPVIGIVVNLLGVCFPLLRLFLLPLLFYLSNLCFLASLFLTTALIFAITIEFAVSRRHGFEILGKFKVVILELIDDGGKCKILFLIWGHRVTLVIFE